MRVNKFTALRFDPHPNISIFSGALSTTFRSPFYSSVAFIRSDSQSSWVTSSSSSPPLPPPPLAAVVLPRRVVLDRDGNEDEAVANRSSVIASGAANIVVMSDNIPCGGMPADDESLHVIRQIVTRAAAAGQTIHLPRSADATSESKLAVLQLPSEYYGSVRFFEVPLESPARCPSIELSPSSSHHSSSSSSSSTGHASKLWLDVAISLGRANRSMLNSSDGGISHNLAATAPLFCLRERVSSAVFVPSSACCTLLGPFPRFGLGAELPFPPPPPLHSAPDGGSASPIAHVRDHLQRVKFAVRRIQRGVWARHASRHYGSKMMLLPEQREKDECDAASAAATTLMSCCHLIPDGRDALQKVDDVCSALLGLIRHRGKFRGSVGDADHDHYDDDAGHREMLSSAEWEHQFCRVLDMYLREEGCTASLVDLVRDVESAGEAKSLLDLIAAWTAGV